MSYAKENVRRVNMEYSGKAIRAQQDADRRREELHQRIPELIPIDRELGMTGIRIMDAFAKNPPDKVQEALDRIKAENLEMQTARADCLKAHGIPVDYSDVKYECPICSDSGQDGNKMCACKKRRLIELGYESSGIGRLMKTQTFDSFRPEMQPDPQTQSEMRQVLNYARKYAESFDPEKSGNLLFIGPTGLGKTHLSTSIAAKVIEKGYDVVFETASNLFADFENEHFGRVTVEPGEEAPTEKYFRCDLLILDDLGTEMNSNFITSCLYNLINTRLNRGKTMLINTNLDRDELRKRYTDRVFSRLVGECLPICFRGADARGRRLPD